MRFALSVRRFAQLRGRVVRFVFLDEGGISHGEPTAIVAGIFVHGDEKLIPLENELKRLRHKHIPEDIRDGFVFHATDIWSGGGKVFRNREKWPLLRRLEILHDLCRVPKKLDIPVVHFAADRSELVLSREGGKEATRQDKNIVIHSIAFSGCVLHVEKIMRLKWPNEVAQLVAEDNGDVRKFLKDVHEILRYPFRERNDEKIIPNDILPLDRVRSSIHFAEKPESESLQLADVCAFVIRGHLRRHPHIGPLYQKIKSMMLLIPEEEVYSGPVITASPPYRSVWGTRPF
jgi:hypothetical protein